MKTRTKKNYPIYAGGHRWSADTVALTELPDGTLAVSQAELVRLHRAIANALCGGTDILTFDELEFLCDVTSTTYTQVAQYLDLNKSTITTWRRKGTVPSRITSNVLKRWFWFRLFGAELAREQLPLSGFRNDESFLQSATQRAIHSHATSPVELRG